MEEPQARLAAGATIPRDDLPADPQRTQILHNTFRVNVPMDQTVSTAFGAGELISVRNQATTIRGIMTSVPAPLPGSNPALVNVAGDPSGIASFDTIDHIHFIRRLQPPYSYTVTEAICQIARSPSTIAPGTTALAVVAAVQVEPTVVSGVVAHVPVKLKGRSWTVPRC